MEDIDATTLLDQVVAKVYNDRIAKAEEPQFYETYEAMPAPIKHAMKESILPYFNATYELLKEAIPTPDPEAATLDAKAIANAYQAGLEDGKAIAGLI